MERRIYNLLVWGMKILKQVYNKIQKLLLAYCHFCVMKRHNRTTRRNDSFQ